MKLYEERVDNSNSRLYSDLVIEKQLHSQQKMLKPGTISISLLWLEATTTKQVSVKGVVDLAIQFAQIQKRVIYFLIENPEEKQRIIINKVPLRIINNYLK